MMPCVCCFFDNEHQKLLKEKCLKESSFIEKLIKYKEYYIDEFIKLHSIKDCNCYYSRKYKNETEYVKFCNDLLSDYKGKISLFEKLFDGLIDTYKAYTKGNISDAYKRLNDYINNYCTNYSDSNSVQFSQVPLFRGRPIGDYDIKNIHEYYHISFNKRKLARSQRFSIAGKPMLYLSRSIPTDIQELGNEFNNINFALYVPKYSWFYNRAMYNITNSIANNLNNSIYPLMNGGSKIEYDNSQFVFSKNKADTIIGDSILFQILTFPVDTKNQVIEEYILPQMFTDNLQKEGYAGLIYQTTKKIIQLDEELKGKELDYNYCFFVPDDGKNEYNEKLLECFYTVCIGDCKENVTINDVGSLINNCKAILKNNKNYILDEYSMLNNNIERHIKLMRKIDISDKTYYDTEEGNVEVRLLYRLMKKIKEVIEDPKKFGIIKYEELK
ncbi:hypothetical protein [Clostridium ljungdahlii]|uniref:RES domain-containing protein n=2 Tax=Clostridium ljungdahlii (strain ATCC 55383 / DSM 13528 / PETC) TaxID=748727 RepID=D8GLR6_CLOLD|nr:hypothetical protein [Clostridium ljungdahlii]ADK13462.1 hypothetical protein CLJU_c03800 [Clostridium ljungdahlii DSM 13528]